jgi:CRISPR/Cas system-associated protein Cas7 (RAMP superfamily)
VGLLIFIKTRRVSMVKGSNVEYLWSVHLLKKLREENMISDEEYAAIDRENRKSFYKNDNQRIA